MPRPTTPLLLLLVLMLAAEAAAGQEPYTPMVPAGSVRIGAFPSFSTWSSRFGISRTGGTITEQTERLGSDFTGDPLGSSVFPALLGFEDAVRTASAGPFDLNLGSLRSVIEKSQIRVPLELDVGVTDWLNVGIAVPVVQNEAAVAFDFQADSLLVNAGLSPGVIDSFETDSFLGDFQTAIDAFQVTQMATCQSDPSSAACLDATALLGDATQVQSAMATMYQAFSLAPFAGSAASAAIEARLSTIDLGFSAAGVSGTPVVLPVATAPLGLLDFQALITDPRFGTDGSYPLQRWLSRWIIGDVELRMNLRLLHLSGGEDSRTELTIGGGVTYRLGTGMRDDPANFLDQGTGDGQDDIELRGWINTQWGGRLGVWGDLRYGTQQGDDALRRVFDPDFLLAPAATQAAVEWTPGDYQRFEVAPWFRIADQLTFLPTYRYFHKGEDTFALLGGGTGSLDPTVLTLESGVTLQEIGLGMVYSSVPQRASDPAGPRFEIRSMYRSAFSGEGGQVPKTGTFEAGFRLFVSLWGS
ncbi:MAG: hypothetical protein ACR2QM_05445 [Longimicrobiales bacterium]